MAGTNTYEVGSRSLSAAEQRDLLPEPYLPCVSPAMQALAASLARIAATDAPVLITGETGSGKSTLAQQLYEDSARRSAPLLCLHGATTTADIVDGLAARGEQIVVLEEIGDLAPPVQDSLVHLLASLPPRSGLRFICTTSRDLNELVERQSMRADLLYRVDVVRLDIPPLRQRPEDITFLAEHFLAMAALHFRRDVRAFAADASARLLQHRWRGNVRELKNCILESVLHCAHVQLRAADLRLRPGLVDGDPEAELFAVLARLHASQPAGFYARVQRLLLQWALQACAGNRVRTATLLGLGRGALRAKLRRYGLDDGAATAAIAPAREQ